ALFGSERHRDVLMKTSAEIRVPPESRFSFFGSVPGFRAIGALTDGRPDSAPADRRAGLVMTYTSGTTGRPRGVRRPLANIDPETSTTQYASFLMLFGIMPGSTGAHLVVAPLYHTAVFNFSTNFLHLGHTLVLMDKWTPEGTLEL